MDATNPEMPTDVATPQPIKGWVVLGAPILAEVLFVLLFGGSIAAYAIAQGAHDVAGIQSAALKMLRGYYVAMGISDAFYLSLLFAVWLLLPKRGPASLTSYFPRPS